MLLPSGNPFKCNEEFFLSLQPMIPPLCVVKVGEGRFFTKNVEGLDNFQTPETFGFVRTVPLLGAMKKEKETFNK